ncbi:hypothetical protein TorRG33x02_192810, partial [Trema orientale]
LAMTILVALARSQRCSHRFYSVCLSSGQGLIVQICLWLFLLTNVRVAWGVATLSPTDSTPFA